MNKSHGRNLPHQGVRSHQETGKGSLCDFITPKESICKVPQLIALGLIKTINNDSSDAISITLMTSDSANSRNRIQGSYHED